MQGAAERDQSLRHQAYLCDCLLGMWNTLERHLGIESGRALETVHITGKATKTSGLSMPPRVAESPAQSG